MIFIVIVCNRGFSLAGRRVNIVILYLHIYVVFVSYLMLMQANNCAKCLQELLENSSVDALYITCVSAGNI